MLSTLFVGALFVLCGILGFLQYRWIGEVSLAECQRLRTELQASLDRLSLDFNTELTTACRALVPAASGPNGKIAEQQILARYTEWTKTARHGRFFSQVAVATSNNDALRLRMLDADTGVFRTVEWPASWNAIRAELEARVSPEPLQDRRPPGPPPEDAGFLLSLPLFGPPPPDAPPAPFVRGRAEWLILQLNPEYVRDVLLPELLQRHLGVEGSAEYQVEVRAKTQARTLVFRSDASRAQPTSSTADASVSLFDPRYDRILRPRMPSGMREDRPRPPEMPRRPDAGRWEMLVRHHAGSLDAVVARTRTRNLAVTGAVLLLMMASLAALLRFTSRAQRLAELQMDFVAGVSHELRTPLTVIHTAAYNLRGKVAANPSQVERYGDLIQRESRRLKELVEQVLRFAGANAGHVIEKTELLSVKAVIDESVESSRGFIESFGCIVEQTIEPGLPPILGDPMALKHAIENLLSNAVKYGAKGSNWIGISASATRDKEQELVEIRVVDRGPGIPADEEAHIFDPFFRGRQARQDQIHGSGLGLNIVKKIIEAHGGNIQVNSKPMKGSELIVRIPAAPAGAQT